MCQGKLWKLLKLLLCSTHEKKSVTNNSWYSYSNDNSKVCYSDGPVYTPLLIVQESICYCEILFVVCSAMCAHLNGCIPGYVIVHSYEDCINGTIIYTNKIEAIYKTVPQSDIFILSCHDYKQVQILQYKDTSLIVVWYMTYCTYTSN